MCDGEAGRCLEDMVKDDDGDYVLYAAHAAVVERLRYDHETEVQRLTQERDDDRRREYGYSQQVVDALAKERDALQAEVERLRAALEMVRDADDDCREDGLPTIPEAARRRIDAAIDAARGNDAPQT